ncbi:unnamed protein product [Bursaphelenchus okinawaensis]|uniref:Choline/carnitine acyltransferase domain-containing protein n=1 Tax=Bursaphelenchus okinawaensis TaxID=465554 RepID=A0A811KJB0_9BILA|nr:unnamed protein product [Bursaphelenchus okinawaensis]CAG9105781.1 unnamed protein product [Bursaphelenchus okinawaensis]
MTTIPQSSTSQELLKLPVPELKDTFAKFVYFSRVLCAKKNHQEAVKLVQQFLDSPTSKKLQTYLKERQETTANWLTPWWNEHGYLRYRMPLPIYSSVGISSGRIAERGEQAQLEFTAKTIKVLTKFVIAAKRRQLPLEKYGGRPLDMDHHHRFFATTRIPKPECDEVYTIDNYDDLEGNIVVVRRGHTFIMSVWDVNRRVLTEEKILKELKSIVKQTQTFSPHPINLVSSTDRDSWAKVYQNLKTRYPHSLKLYENALFVIGLDEPTIPKPGQRHEDAHLLNGVHGHGAKNNAINRWQDKFNMFFDADGFYGLLYEHTPADGAPLSTVIETVYKTALKERKDGFVETYKNDVVSTPTQKLVFKLTDDDKKAIKKASDSLEKEIQKVDCKYFNFDEFGKNVPKAARISPDSFIQIALQLAFYRLHKRHGNAYESASLRLFKNGRTETIRLPNEESTAFAETFTNNKRNATDKELLKLLNSACKAHKTYSDVCANGNGMDRHLFGLRIAAKETNTELPKVFSSKAMTRLTTFDLSTSQVPMSTRPRMIYAPLTEDGYGALYNPREDTIDIGISVFTTSKETDLDKFKESVFQSFRDMRDILIKNKVINQSHL